MAQLEFDFMADIAKVEADKKHSDFVQKWDRLDFNPAEDKPPEIIRNDNDLIRLYEYKYRHGEPVYLTKIYFLCRKISAKILNQIISKKKIYVDSDELKWKAENCATYVIEQYIQRPDFQFLRPTSYLYLRAKHELFYKTKADEIVDFMEADDFVNLQREMEKAL